MEGKVYSLRDKIEVCSISRAFLCILFIRNLSNRQSINFFYQKDLRFKITIPPCFVVSEFRLIVVKMIKVPAFFLALAAKTIYLFHNGIWRLI